MQEGCRSEIVDCLLFRGYSALTGGWVTSEVYTLSALVNISAEHAVVLPFLLTHEGYIVRTALRMLAETIACFLRYGGNYEVRSCKTPESPNTCQVGATCHCLPPSIGRLTIPNIGKDSIRFSKNHGCGLKIDASVFSIFARVQGFDI